MNRSKWIRAGAAWLLLVAAAPGDVHASEGALPEVKRLASGKAVTIGECVKIALALNPSLRASEQNAAASDRAVLEAYANYLPSISGSFDGSRTSGQTTGPFGNTQAVEFDRFSTGFNVRQNLFTYSGYRSITGARKTREASRAGVETNRQELILEVKQRFHEVLKTADLLGVAKENLTVGEEQLKLAEKRKEVGAGVIADVLKAKAQVESNRLNVISAEKNAATAKAMLLSSLGLDLSLPLVLAEPPPVEPTTPPFAESLKLAYENRPDLIEGDLLYRAAMDGIGRARGEWIPSLSGSFSYGWQDTALTADLFDEVNRGWTASFSMNMPLFNGGTLSRIRQSRASAEEARWNLESTRQSIALDVQEAILSIEESVKKMDVAARNVSAAEEDLRVSQGKYRHGLVPILDLIESQAALAKARAEKVEAFHNYLSSRASYEKAIGIPE